MNTWPMCIFMHRKFIKINTLNKSLQLVLHETKNLCELKLVMGCGIFVEYQELRFFFRKPYSFLIICYSLEM